MVHTDTGNASPQSPQWVQSGVETGLRALKTTRDEQEVAGYAEVMELVFSSWQDMALTENHVKQLHRDLLTYSETDGWHRGNYKTSTNSVVAFDEDGQQLGVVFETATPFDTLRLMAELVGWFTEERAAARLHPLLLIGIWVVVFLEIHPRFRHGAFEASQTSPPSCTPRCTA